MCGVASASTPRPTADRLALRFPWGLHPLPPEGLDLGREFGPSDLRGRLEPYTNVGRKHARLAFDGRAWMLTDLRSTNGTFIDDVRIPADTPHAVAPGVTIRLAAHLEFTLEAC